MEQDSQHRPVSDTTIPKAQKPPKIPKFFGWRSYIVIAILILLAGLTAAYGFRESLKEFFASQRINQLEQQLTYLSKNMTMMGAQVNTLNEALAHMQTAQAELQKIGKFEEQLSDLQQKILAKPATGLFTNEQEKSLLEAYYILKKNVLAGDDYRDDLARLAVFMPVDPDIQTLGLLGSERTKTTQELVAELQKIAQGLGEKSTADEPVFLSIFSSKIRIKNDTGYDWAAITQAAFGQAQAGRLDRAVALLANGAGKPSEAITAWQSHAEARIRLDNALVKLGATILEKIAAAELRAQP